MQQDAVLLGQPDVDVEQRAEIGDVLDPGREAVGASFRFRADGEALGPQRQRSRAGCGRVAADVEPAAAAEMPGLRHGSVKEGAAADEAGDEAVGRLLVELALRADLADLALLHHHQPVGHGQRLLLVVRDHDRGQAELSLQVADLDADLLAQFGVEIGERFVEQKHVGLHGERPGERDALLLAAGELARVALVEPGQAHEPQGLGDPRRAVGGSDLAHFQTEGDDLRDRHMREERIGLEDQAAIALPGRQGGDVALADGDLAGSRLDEARDHAQGRGLATTGGAEQDEEFTLGDVDAAIVDGGELAIDLAQMLDRKPCHVQTTRLSLT